MKKFRIALMSIFTLLLGSVLVGCNFKKPEIDFSKEQVYISAGEEVDLRGLLNVKEVDAKDVRFRFEDSSLFQVSEGKIKAKSRSGESYVYATYNNDVFASIKVFVKQKFSTPKNFSMNENGLISWDKSLAIYSSETTPTFASSYRVYGTYTSYTGGQENEPETFEVFSNTNSYQLENEGVYNIKIVAQGTDRFDASAEYAVQSFGFGYMPKIATADLIWSNDGVLSWETTEIENAEYEVYVDGIKVVDKQSQKSADLSELFDELQAKNHTIKVVVYDAVGDKMPTESDAISVLKLASPVATYAFSAENGGLISLGANPLIDHYKFTLVGDDEEVVTIDNEEDGVLTSLDMIDAGVYSLSIQAIAVEGNYYQSDKVSFGKIYKLETLTISGTDKNVENSNTFNLLASANASVDTILSVNVGETKTTSIGIEAGETSAEFEVEVPSNGIYSVSAKQFAKEEQNTIFGERVYVLNSNLSEAVVVEKLEAISNITHEIESEKSVFVFDEVENADKYEVFALDGEEFALVDSSLYSCEISQGKVRFVFDDKIENLNVAQNEKVFTIKFVAKKNDETLTINSAKQKVLTELDIAGNVEKENLNKVYSWTAVENADAYRVGIYNIDKATFIAGQTDIDTTTLDKNEEVVDTNSYTFANEGYYLVKVFSLTENANEFINSTESFDRLVCVSEKLVVEDFDVSFVGGKYNVVIENKDHFDKYEVYLDDVKILDTTASSEENSTYILETDFADETKTYKIEVVAKANDNVLYENSEKKAVRVVKLPQIVGEDIEIAKQSIAVGSDMKTATQSQEMKVSAVEGARGVLLYQETNPAERAGGEDATTATYDLGTIANTNFVFKYFGSAKQGNVFVKTNGYIYLDSEESTINISRLETPTNCEYVNGVLKFNNTNTAITEYYVVTIVCKGQDGERRNIVVELSTEAKATYGENSEVIGNGGDFVSNNVNEVSISIEDLIEAVSNVSDVEIRQVYSQAASFGFAVYSYANIVNDDAVVSSSNYAGTALDANTKVVVVEKMTAPEISYQIIGENIVFNWDAVSTDAAVSAQTTYQMFVNGNEYGQVISGTQTASYALSEFALGTYYTFALTAPNPNYIESSLSNKVRIFRLNKITSLKLLTGGDYDGQLQYELSSQEQEFVDYVLVGEEHNQTGKIEISAPGAITLKVVGKKNVESQDMTTTYIDSETTTWTLSQMQTLKPALENFEYNNGVLSWDEFAEGNNFENLKYVLIFTDSQDNIVSYTTNQNEVSISETTLDETLQRLVEGNIDISLYAKLETYDVVAGGTIYYSNKITLENDFEVANYHKYANTLSISKLPTPVVSNVEFVEDSTNGIYNTPNIEITFTGDYGNEADFVVSSNIDGQEITTETVKLTKNADSYKYVMQAEKYKNKFASGKTIVFKIAAISEENIPSSVGSVNVLCANTISGFEIKEDKNGEGLSHLLQINVAQADVQKTAGGFDLAFGIIENGGSEKYIHIQKSVSTVSTTQTFDITDVIETHLANGGFLTISITTRSYSNAESGVYILACPTYYILPKYDVLSGVTQANITKTAGGFEIDKTVNNETTKYKVVYGANVYDVIYKDDKFYFEVPTTWVNGNYELKIYAVESDYIYSKQLNYTFVLNRIDNVTNVSITRDSEDLSDGKIEWTNVSGAAGYMLRIYSDNTRSKEITRVSSSTNSLKFSEIFTEEFYDELRINEEDKDIFVGIAALGQNETANDSQEYTFNAKVCGNYFDVEEEIKLNEYGLVTFKATAGKTYIYRFVDTAGQVLSDWVEVTAEDDIVTIDASVLNRDSSNNVRPAGTVFDIQIIVVGSYDGDTISFNSKPVSTEDSDVKFLINAEISKIEYNSSYAEYITFEMQTFEAASQGEEDEESEEESSAIDILYYGVEADAIKTGKVSYITPKVLKNNDDGTSIYGCKLIDLILDMTSEENVEKFGELPSGDTTIYFWSYRKDDGEILNDYINSPAKGYVINHTADANFVGIEKYGLPEDAQFQEDYANTFALFETNETLLNMNVGVVVRVTDGNETITKFISRAEMVGNEYFEGRDVIVANLTNLFETTNGLKDMYGDLTIDILRVKIQTLTQRFVISDWTEAIEFKRIQGVDKITLSAGAVSWKPKDTYNGSFYVYLISKDAYDEETGIIDGNYSVFRTTNTYFSIMDKITEDDEFYIAIQAIGLPDNILPSAKLFVMENGKAKLIRKNKITNKLNLENGNLSFDWTGSDLIEFLNGVDEVSVTKVDELYKSTFNIPFTFNITDFVKEQYVVRFRFTNKETNKVQTFDVDAQEFVTNEFLTETVPGKDYTYEQLLTNLATIAGSTVQKNEINTFVSMLKKSRLGVGNSKNLFDDYFETLQAGNYSLEYSLVGRNYSISSNWVSFENAQGENSVYVLRQPNIKVLRTPSNTDSSKNYYKVFIKMVSLHYFENGVDTEKLAEHYVWKVYKKTEEGENAFVFDIQKSGDDYAVSLLGVDGYNAKAIRCDENGNADADGMYIMFYLNLEEDSILGRFGNEFDKTNYKFQIYAVGNDLCISSKTEMFEIVFLGFDTGLSVIDGVFNWTTQMNRNTTVIYKKDSSIEEKKVVLNGSGSSITYSLEGAGLYNYIKFISFGEVAGNKVYVDSEIYTFKNVYKLEKPVLQNLNGNIAINDSGNKTWIEKCYSTTSLYNYRIYNNVSTETSYITFVDGNEAKDLYMYEPGTTNIESSDPNFEYKKTEFDPAIQTFYVSSIGSTSRFVFEKDPEQNGVINAYCKEEKDGEEGKNNLSIAISSDIADFNAKMMNTVSKVEIKDGIITWNKVEKSVLNYGDDETMDLTLPNKTYTVYKVTIEQYNEKGGVPENSEAVDPILITKYTTKEQFDFAYLSESEFSEDAEYIKVTVQALALSVSQTVPEGIADNMWVRLVDGRIGYGLTQYQERYKENEDDIGTKFYVLLGQGASIDQITHTAHVDDNSLKVENGKVYWTYTLDGAIANYGEDYDLFKNYQFTIFDKDSKDITGQNNMTVVNKEGKDVEYIDQNGITQTKQCTVFTIEFEIDDGLLDGGQNTLSVFVNKVDDTKSVKSYGRSIKITKMENVDESYTVIDELMVFDDGTVLERLDVSKYFEDYGNATIFVKAHTLKDAQTEDATEQTFVLTKENTIIYILSNDSHMEETIYLDGNPITLSGVNAIVVEDNGSSNLEIKAESEDDELDKKNYIYSDTYDKIILKRLEWNDEDNISWEVNPQQFKWTYHGYFATQSDIKATAVTQSGETFVEDEDSEEETITVGTMYKIVKHLDNIYSIIEIDGVYYKVEREDVVGPTFIVTIKYETKTCVYDVNEYEIKHDEDGFSYQEYTIEPTVIGEISSISIRIKLGPTNIESQENENNNEGQGFEFNLFAAGEGIESSPYQIATKAEFENIGYRLSKSQALKDYDGIKTFYFKLIDDIDLGEIDGYMFAEEFAGVLDGDNHTITYKSNSPTSLEKQIKIANRVNTEQVYEQGTALFNKFASLAVVKNLNVDVTYGEYSTTVNTILAGLVLTNYGKLNNVNLTGFRTEFTGFHSNPIIGICYAGLVGLNAGVDAEINGCKNLASVEIDTKDFESASDDDEGYVNQYVRFAGIAGANQATITNCENGILNQTTIEYIGDGNKCHVEIAGISLVNGANAKITNCTNKAVYAINVTNLTEPWEVDAAGIVIKNSGTITSNTNECYTDLTAEGLTVNQGEIFVS